MSSRLRRELRAILWILGLSILILADEWVKEGYFIKPEDFLKPFTHESLLAALWLGSLIWAFFERRWKKGRGE